MHFESLNMLIQKVWTLTASLFLDLLFLFISVHFYSNLMFCESNYCNFCSFGYLMRANAGQTAPGCVPNLPQIVFPIVFAMPYLWPGGLHCNSTISGVVWEELIRRVKALSKQGLWVEYGSESGGDGGGASSQPLSCGGDVLKSSEGLLSGVFWDNFWRKGRWNGQQSCCSRA